jgi:pilus assembly protein CpaD
MTSEFENMSESRSRAAAAVRLVCLGAFVALATAGCRNNPAAPPPAAAWTLVDPSQRHPIIVSQQPQTMEMRIASSSRGLTPLQRADLLEFTDHAKASDAGNSRLVISAPGGSANEVAAMYAVGQIRQILSDNGFPDASIAVEGYRAGEARDAPVRVSYLRFVAEGPVCGAWPTNLAFEPNNLPYPNFGCANQKNLAAMVANPADLLGPRTESDRPSERRDVVWDNYVRGESTTAKKSEDERVQVKSN